MCGFSSIGWYGSGVHLSTLPIKVSVLDWNFHYVMVSLIFSVSQEVQFLGGSFFLFYNYTCEDIP